MKVAVLTHQLDIPICTASFLRRPSNKTAIKQTESQAKTLPL